MPTTLRDVRFQGQSGKHMLASSFSGFDPKDMEMWNDFESAYERLFMRPAHSAIDEP
jgi:hypothetical protein